MKSAPESRTSPVAEAIEALLGAGDQLSRLTQIEARLDQILMQQQVERLRIPDGLHPDHVYNYQAVGRFLGMERASVRQISKTLLPRIRDGYVRGVDVMAYRGDITYDMAKAYVEARRRQVAKVISEAA